MEVAATDPCPRIVVTRPRGIEVLSNPRDVRYAVPVDDAVDLDTREMGVLTVGMAADEPGRKRQMTARASSSSGLASTQRGSPFTISFFQNGARDFK